MTSLGFVRNCGAAELAVARDSAFAPLVHKKFYRRARTASTQSTHRINVDELKVFSALDFCIARARHAATASQSRIFRCAEKSTCCCPTRQKIFCTACIRERVDGPLDAQKRANRTQLIRPATSFADRIRGPLRHACESRTLRRLTDPTRALARSIAEVPLRVRCAS